MIDLRSDTLTRPTKPMLEVMMNAKLGDDVFGDDPTVNELEAKAAATFGMEAALYCPSGTMTNQIAVKTHTQPGDEIILPAFTFVSTANAFMLRGAKLVFADSEERTPNIDVSHVQQLITPRTKVIVAVHYAGVACDMDPLMVLAQKHNLYVVEDAAQAIDSFYKDKPLGSIGHLSCFSFHETKNIISGEGGMLVVNDDQFANRSEVIWDRT